MCIILPKSVNLASSSFVRDLQRLQAQLTAVADSESLVSLLTDNYRSMQFAAGNNSQLSCAPSQHALTPQLWYLAERILRFSEGLSAADTLTRSARMLGCLQLTTPEAPRRWRDRQFGYKLLYRAVLSLRLMDHALQQQLITEPDWLDDFASHHYDDDNSRYRLNRQIPLVIAVMLLDAGQLSAQASVQLAGTFGELDPTRALSSDERADYLLTVQQATSALIAQLETMPYVGNSKAERQLHMQQQQQNLQFIRRLLAEQMNPASQHGNLLKVPAVYSSIVLPGRQRFQYEALPKASLLLQDSVKRGMLDAKWVQHLLRITGVFPQGFGITFIPQQTENSLSDKYELAIVNQLYPRHPAVPHCRVVSRNLQYRRGGHNCAVSIENNLYFKPARQRLTQLSPQRLQEILSRLSADWQPGQVRSYLPRCWLPMQFFSQAEHQNLWNQARHLAN